MSTTEFLKFVIIRVNLLLQGSLFVPNGTRVSSARISVTA